MANITFAKESKTDFQANKKVQKIIIVDDDQSIHEITNMALRAMDFSDFELEVFSAYSSSEAKEILNQEDDIALALIDVVMDTPTAGLDLVNYIRNDLENKLIRLIIRTGQANDFPQMHVIQHYDINDFKEKTELTIERLYTTIRTSIKQYEQLIELQNKYEETYRQLTTNPLTRLPNRIKWNDPQILDTFLFVNFVDLGRHGIRAGEVNAKIYRRVQTRSSQASDQQQLSNQRCCR